jgi:hypothetical protein
MAAYGEHDMPPSPCAAGLSTLGSGPEDFGRWRCSRSRGAGRHANDAPVVAKGATVAYID